MAMNLKSTYFLAVNLHFVTQKRIIKKGQLKWPVQIS